VPRENPESRPLGAAARSAGLGAAVLPGVACWLVPGRCRPASAGCSTPLLLYLALGGRSLAEHAERVADDLAAGDLPAAREHVGWIVSRNTEELDESGVAKACVESTLENGNDAVFGALFWFALLGGPGAVLFRLANTLDAMWGYRNRALPALRLGGRAHRRSAELHPGAADRAVLRPFGDTRRALRCWRGRRRCWESPNAGPVMAAGAGSLGLALGGPAVYHGRLEERPVLGEGRPARGEDIRAR
jgi:adenosylcobinamide-phosphate synthase